MMKILINLFLVCFLFFTGCKSNEPNSTIAIPETFIGEGGIEVFNIYNEILEEIESENPNMDINTEGAVILNILKGRTHSYVHVASGEQLILDTVPGRSNMLQAIGELSPENVILQEFDKLVFTQEEESDFAEIAKKEPLEFINGLESTFAKLNALVEKVQLNGKLSSEFKKSIQYRLLTTKGSSLSAYPDYYKYLNKKDVVVPEDFYTELESIDFTDPAVLDFEESRYLATTWHAKDLDYANYDSAVDYFDAVSKSVEESYPVSLIQEYCKHTALSDQINYGDGIDSVSDLVENFNTSVTNPILIHKMKKTTDPWEKLRAGMEAPNFNALSRSGENVKLSDLKGKTVYVDVWATWCGPCIAEIPALKSLEKEMHDENIEFVSVSIDNEKDKQKWKDFVKEKDLKGVQLMAKGAWESDIVNDYNIGGIPRFLVIDETGKIKNANAPRPSESRIKEVLLN